MFFTLFIKLYSIYEEDTSYIFFSYDGFEIENDMIVKYNNEGGNVVIPSVVDGVVITKIGDYAFNDLNIDSIIIPNTIVNIGDYAFSNNNLKSLTLLENVREIGEGAFMHNKIENLEIKGNVKYGKACFNDNSLDFDDAFFYDSNKLISYGGLVRGHVEIPDGTDIIGEKAFLENNIVSVSIPESVLVIESEAFKNNYLVELYLPSTINSIEVNAFLNNDYLSEIVIDKDVNSLLNYPWGADNSDLYWTKK